MPFRVRPPVREHLILIAVIAAALLLAFADLAWIGSDEADGGPSAPEHVAVDFRSAP